MKPPGTALPIVVTKWYAYAKWLLERVESFPKSQRFILGQRLSNHAMDVLELLVKASYARESKNDLLRQRGGALQAPSPASTNPEA
jgi:hypothetical protein